MSSPQEGLQCDFLGSYAYLMHFGAWLSPPVSGEEAWDT
jgi:hypothetical protein